MIESQGLISSAISFRIVSSVPFSMHDRAAWSLSLGQWRGVHVRLHMFFLLFAACALFLKWHLAQPMTDLDWVIPLSLVVLFFSVLFHETGHIWLARHYDGIGDLIVVGPLGGMVPMHVLGDARAEFRVHLTGPLMNLLVCLACVPLLILLKTQIWGLMNPLSPVDLATGSMFHVLVKLIFWINWALFVINLIPAFPLDGAYALRTAILAGWPTVRPATASTIVARTAQVLACLLAVGALLWRFDETQLFVPIRLSLLVFAILLFFAARQRRLLDEQDEADNLLLGYEFPGDLDALEQDIEESSSPTVGPLSRWIQSRQRRRQRRQLELELQEEQRVDEILARLHKEGRQALSNEDLAILNRVSLRYRSRMSAEGRLDSPRGSKEILP